jgi:diguanylate cyclase (GGDEF)-like protein
MQQQRRLEDREVSILMVEAGQAAAADVADAGTVGAAESAGAAAAAAASANGAAGPGRDPAGEAPPAGSAPLVVRYAIDPEHGVSASRPHQPGWRLDASAFLLDLGPGSDAVLVVGPELRRIDRGDGGPGLLNRAATGAAAWRRERARALRRLKLPDRLLAFTEELNRAHSEDAVCSTLMEHVGRIVGGYTGLVFLHEVSGPATEALFPVKHRWISNGLTGSSLSADLRFIGPGLVHADEVIPATGSPFGNLAGVFRETSACAMAHVPLGDRGLLLLVERRGNRVFEADDWDLLRSIARQAEVALERVALFERVHALSLTDPLTGLGNRRKMEIVLEHSLAAARRGQPLSLVMLDLDGFKEFNDTWGHVRGDEVLRTFAATLQEHVRGSDLVIRYGGDEFLFVLTGADAEAAARTIDRVREHTPASIRFTAGIAEYDPTVTSPAQLVERADRQLYAVRRRPLAVG